MIGALADRFRMHVRNSFGCLTKFKHCGGFRRVFTDFGRFLGKSMSSENLERAFEISLRSGAFLESEFVLYSRFQFRRS